MVSTRTNIIANFAGNAWSALLGIIFVPIYLEYVGVESYGLIGLLTSLQAFLSFMDFGLSPTFNRELARLSISPENGKEMHDLKRTLSTLNWLSAFVILIILCGLSPLIANFWLQPKDLSTDTITNVLLIMSSTIAIHFMTGFYGGGLLGLQKQVVFNSIRASFGTLRSVGAWLVLLFVSPTIEAFVWWQLLVAFLQAIVTVMALTKSLFPSPSKGRFRKDLLKRVWRFAAGMTSVGVLAMILTQTDKIILSRMLTLENFGYYSLAITISTMAIGIVVGSITNVIYPKYSQLVAIGDEKVLAAYYHRSCQLMSVFLLPVVVMFVFFSYPIILTWTGKTVIADNSYIFLALLAIGAGFNGLITLPYHLQLAYGWTRLGIYLTSAAIVTLVPLMILGVTYYGAIGGIFSWILYNSVFGIIMISLMHRRILVEEKWKWYLQDVFQPLIPTAALAALGKYLFVVETSRGILFLQLAFVSVAALFIACLSTPFSREWLFQRISFYRRSQNQID